MRRVLLIIVTLVFAQGGMALTAIELRSSAVIGPGAVLLGDVATLSGTDASALASLVVCEGVPSGGRVSLDEVRSALDAAGVHWGRVSLRGGDCVVRQGEVRLSVAEGETVEQERSPGVIDLSGPETVKTKIARVLGALYGTENEDLRVLFDERDEAFLEIMDSGKRYEVVATSGASSARAPITVNVFEGESLTETRTVRADVEVRVEAVVLRRRAERGESISSGDVMKQWVWVTPTGSPVVAEVSVAVGRLARTTLTAGTVLREALLELPIVIRRNELATVHCLSGSVTMRVEARAMDDGHVGDVIEFRKDRRSAPFRARVSGPGIAVATTEKEARP